MSIPPELEQYQIEPKLGESGYLQSLWGLLPRFATSLKRTGLFGGLFSVIAKELARFEEFVYACWTESIPGASETYLEDWENQYGFPDETSTPDQDITARQRAVQSRHTASGAVVSNTYLEELAASLGFVATVEQTYDLYESGTCGIASSGYSCCDWLYGYAIIYVTIISGTGDYQQMKAIFNKVKQAHTIIKFSYSQVITDTENDPILDTDGNPILSEGGEL